MNTTIFPTLNVLGGSLLAIFVTLLFLAVMQLAQTPLASVAWRRLASVSWNG